MRAAYTDFLLHGGDVENLIWVWGLRQAPHGFNDHGAAHTVVPGLAQVVLCSIHYGKRRVRGHRIARFQAHLLRFGGGFGAYVQEYPLTRINSGALILRNNVDVADAGDRTHRSLGADDDPTLVDQRLVEPAAQHLHGQVAVRGNAADDAAELVHVRVHHDARPA